MKIRPDMFGIRSERKGVKVEIGSLLIQTLKSVSNTDIDPHSHIVRPDIKSSMVKLDCFISSSQMSKSSSNLVHQKIVGWVKVQSSVEEID